MFETLMLSLEINLSSNRSAPTERFLKIPFLLWRQSNAGSGCVVITNRVLVNTFFHYFGCRKETLHYL